MSSSDLWQRFTNPATRVIHFAQDETKTMRLNVVGTEHLLLGLLREEGLAREALNRLGVTRTAVDTVLMGAPAHAAEEASMPSTRLVLSGRSKRALEMALEEARELNHKLGLRSFVDTEHILLGLLRAGEEGGNRACCVLHTLNVDPTALREEVYRLLGITASTPPPPGSDAAMRGREIWLNLDEAAFRVFSLALEEAYRDGAGRIDLKHLVAACLRAADTPTETVATVRTALADLPLAEPSATPLLTGRCADLFGQALRTAISDDTRDHLITSAHLLAALREQLPQRYPETLARLIDLGIDLSSLG